MAEQNEQDQEIQTHTAPVRADELHEFRELVSRYGASFGTGLALALILILGWSTYRNYQAGQKEQAALAVAVSTTPDDFKNVLSQFENTSTAPIAALGLASSHFDNGDYNAALAAYKEFVVRYPTHPMADSARLCQAQCVEAAGQLEEALQAFTEFREAKPEEHFLRPQADLGRGRCLEQLERWDDAKALYEEFIALYPDSAWITQAEVSLRSVKKAMSAH